MFLEGFGLLPDAGFGLSEVVRREVVQKYREALAEKVESAQRAMDRLNRLLVSDPLPCPQLDVEAEVAAYENALRLRLAPTSFEMLPVPDIPHVEVLARSVAKAKPFSEKGTGYQDYLIWATVVEVLRTLQGEIVFVTANKKDFGEGRPHPDLAVALEEEGIASDRVTILPSLEAFNKTYILPLLRDLGDLKADFEQGAVLGVDLRNYLKEALPRSVIGPDLLEARGLAPEAGEGSIEEVLEVGKIRAHDIRRLSDTSLLAWAEAEVRATVARRFDRSAFDSHRSVREFLGDYRPAAGASVCVREVEDLKIEFEVIVQEGAERQSAPYIHAVSTI